MIIAISGTPGTGKHTVAKVLADKMGYRVIDLGKALNKEKKEREVTLIELNRTFQKLKKDNSIVISHLSHLINSPDIRMVIVLRTDPLILADRLKHRNYSREKIYDNVMFEAIDGTYMEALKRRGNVFQVDNTLNVHRTVERVLKIINGKEKSETIDFSRKIVKIEKMFK